MAIIKLLVSSFQKYIKLLTKHAKFLADDVCMHMGEELVDKIWHVSCQAVGVLLPKIYNTVGLYTPHPGKVAPKPFHICTLISNYECNVTYIAPIFKLKCKKRGVYQCIALRLSPLAIH